MSGPLGFGTTHLSALGLRLLAIDRPEIRAVAPIPCQQFSQLRRYWNGSRLLLFLGRCSSKGNAITPKGNCFAPRIRLSASYTLVASNEHALSRYSCTGRC
jgi:hypothetical protein